MGIFQLPYVRKINKLHFFTYQIITFVFPTLNARKLANLLYGVCGSGKSRQFGRRVTDVKTGNAVPKLHWSLWEKSGLLDLAWERYFLADNNGHDGGIWAI